MMKEKLYFYYTNDLHSHFDHWSQVATYMKDKQQTRKKDGSSFWLTDIGDHIDRVNPITEATMGKANVELLNELAYDFVTIGNNEGITLSHDDLYHLYDDANFAVVCSNLVCTTEENPTWLLSEKIVVSASGVRIGIIGLTARFNPYYHKLGWDVTDIYDALDDRLEYLSDKTDINVLLSHTGINTDEEIAKRYPEIDVIIGSHTHHLFEVGEVVNDVLLTAGGKLCANVGEVVFTWDHGTNSLTEKRATTTNVTGFPKHFQTEKRLLELKEASDVILEKKIIQVNEPIKAHWFSETEIMLRLTDELSRFAKVDIAMLNAGLLLESFDAGDITYKDVHRVCPHPINPCIVSLIGSDLIEVIKICLQRDFVELKLKGFGFRGEVIGKMIFIGLEITTYVDENGQEFLQDVLFQDELIKSTEVYQVVTADAFTFGKLIPQISNAANKQLLLPEYIRDILVKALLKYNQ